MRDQGPGIEKAHKDRIFDDFFSFRPGAKPGTGLGLGFVRRVIEAQGGTIVEQGTAGKGARFIIKMPSRAPNAALEEQRYVSHTSI